MGRALLYWPPHMWSFSLDMIDKHAERIKKIELAFIKYKFASLSIDCNQSGIQKRNHCPHKSFRIISYVN
jgi:hypothetical protein